MWRLEQRFDVAHPIGFGRHLPQCIHQTGLGRQAGQVERKSAREHVGLGTRSELGAFFRESALNEGVDRVHTLVLEHLRGRSNERPVASPGRTGVDPAAQDIEFACIQRRTMRVRRRHERPRCSCNSSPELARLCISRNDDRVATAIGDRLVSLVEP